MKRIVIILGILLISLVSLAQNKVKFKTVQIDTVLLIPNVVVATGDTFLIYRNDSVFYKVFTGIASGMDSLYIKFADTWGSSGNVGNNDTVYVDTTGGSGGTIDTFYVSYCDGCAFVSGWKTSGDTIYIDTASTSGNFYVNYGDGTANNNTNYWVSPGTSIHIDTAFARIDSVLQWISDSTYWALDGDVLYMKDQADSIVIGDKDYILVPDNKGVLTVGGDLSLPGGNFNIHWLYENKIVYETAPNGKGAYELCPTGNFTTIADSTYLTNNGWLLYGGNTNGRTGMLPTTSGTPYFDVKHLAGGQNISGTYCRVGYEFSMIDVNYIGGFDVYIKFNAKVNKNGTNTRVSLQAWDKETYQPLLIDGDVVKKINITSLYFSSDSLVIIENSPDSVLIWFQFFDDAEGNTFYLDSVSMVAYDGDEIRIESDIIELQADAIELDGYTHGYNTHRFYSDVIIDSLNTAVFDDNIVIHGTDNRLYKRTFASLLGNIDTLWERGVGIKAIQARDNFATAGGDFSLSIGYNSKSEGDYSFAGGRGGVICNCPVGWYPTQNGDGCYQWGDSMSSTFMGAAEVIVAEGNSAYGNDGARLNGNRFVQDTNSFWKTRFDTMGIWTNYGMSMYTWWTFSYCLNITTAGTYYIGIAADNKASVYINGELVFINDDCLDQSSYRMWHITEVKLSEGYNFIYMSGYDCGVVGGFGAEIFTTLDTTSSITRTSIGSIWGTDEAIGGIFDLGVMFTGDTIAGYSCPTGYLINNCSSPPMCYRYVTTPCVPTASTSYVLATGDASFNFSTSGDSLNIGAEANRSAILGGLNHRVDTAAVNSVIIGGNLNRIDTNIYNTVVLGGYNITATEHSTVYTPMLHVTDNVKMDSLPLLLSDTVLTASNDSIGYKILTSSGTSNNIDSILAIADGMAYDKPSLTVRKSGVDLFLDVEHISGGDMRFLIDGNISELDCTTGGGTGGKATVGLTEGTDANNPATNYIYITNSGGTATLNASTSLPTGAFGWVGKVIVPDATTWDATGAYGFQRYTEAFSNSNRGALSHAREKLRALGAVYINGVTHTTNITGGNVVHLQTASGNVYQLHRQYFPTFDTGNYFYGNGLNIYDEINDLSSALNESDGTSLSGRKFNLVIWGAINIDSATCKLFVNLPNGSYNRASTAQADVDNTADYSVPDDMRSVAFLIARMVLENSGGVWTELGTYSLLGTPVGVRSGGSGAVASNEFDDSQFRIYNNITASKLLAFELSGITASTTRTLTVPDADGTIALTSDLLWEFSSPYIVTKSDNPTWLRDDIIASYGTDHDMFIKYNGVDNYGYIAVANENLILKSGNNDSIHMQFGSAGSTLMFENDNMTSSLSTFDIGTSTDKFWNGYFSGNLIVDGTVDGIDISTDVGANTTHRTSNGSDHSYINQDVTTTGTPTFTSLSSGNITLTGGNTNEILRKTSGGAMGYASKFQVSLNNPICLADLLTSQDNFYNLGSDTYSWKDLYLDGNLDLGSSIITDNSWTTSGTTISFTNATATLSFLSATFLPNVSGTISLGLTSNRFANLFLSDDATIAGVARVGEAVNFSEGAIGEVDGDLWYETDSLRFYNGVTTFVLGAGGGGGASLPIDLTTDVTGVLPIANGGTNANTAAGARTSLGLAIGTDVLAQQSIGIANDNLVEIDAADVADNEYARFTVNGLESRTAAEVKADIDVDYTETQTTSTSASILDGSYEELSIAMGGDKAILNKVVVWSTYASDDQSLEFTIEIYEKLNCDLANAEGGNHAHDGDYPFNLIYIEEGITLHNTRLNGAEAAAQSTLTVNASDNLRKYDLLYFDEDSDNWYRLSAINSATEIVIFDNLVNGKLDNCDIFQAYEVDIGRVIFNRSTASNLYVKISNDSGVAAIFKVMIQTTTL